VRRTLLLAFACLLAALSASLAPAAREQVFPARIGLPDGFQPEGIAIAGQQAYVGSIPTGSVWRGNLRTGRGAVLVNRTGRAAIGVDVDRGRIFVAGGMTGRAFVYNAGTGADIATLQLTSGGTFVNDVVVTRQAAWFTDSSNPVLYRVPLSRNGRPGTQSAVRAIQLTGDYDHQPGFNLNGIDATPNGGTLVVVQSNTGRLFTVTTSGSTREISLGGVTVMNGDGILLDGRTLYVVRNRNNQIAVIALSANLSSGRIVRTITSPSFDVPTTIDELGRRLYAVNARFGTPPSPTTDYWITQVRK
jgi:sugar lactone lactonase YvrE